jgi:hypothetical protein
MAGFDNDLSLDLKRQKPISVTERFTGNEAELIAPIAPAVPSTIIEPADPKSAERIALGNIKRRLTEAAPGEVAARQQILGAGTEQSDIISKDIARAKERLKERVKLQEKADTKSAEIQLLEVDREAKIQETENKLRADIETERLELGQKEPKAFWGKADTSDKILMGLSVMVGAIGQGISQSRTNAALVMMDKVIDQDLENQFANIDRQMKLLDKREISAGRKAELSGRLIGKKIAIEKAAFDQVERAIDRMKLVAKGEDQISALEMAGAKLKESQGQRELDYQTGLRAVSESQFDTAIDVESGEIVTSPEGRKIEEDLKNKRKAENKKPLTESQAKNWKTAFMGNSSLEGVESIENKLGSVEEIADKLGQAGGTYVGAQAATDVALIGSAIEFSQALSGTTTQEFFRDLAGDDGAEYISEARNFIALALRQDSGAAISMAEWRMEYPRYFPVPGESAGSIEAKRRIRREIVTAARKASGDSELKLFFDEGGSAKPRSAPKIQSKPKKINKELLQRPSQSRSRL